MVDADHEVRCLLADLLATKSEGELESVLVAIRGRGVAALRSAARSLAKHVGGTRRLDRAAIALAVEVGGPEGRELLLALVGQGNVEVEERAAAMAALPWHGSDETLSRLLDELAGEGHLGPTELSEAIIAHLHGAPQGFDWRGAVRRTHGGAIARLARCLPGDCALSALRDVVSAEHGARRGPSSVYQRYSLHHAVPSFPNAPRPYNPHLAEFENLSARPEEGFWKREGELDELRKSYSYAVPTRSALRLAASYSPLVEIGAGAGYWAWLLRQLGARVVAYDIEPPDGTYRNGWFAGARAWTAVLRGGPEAVVLHPGHSLFLCWPPPGDPMAADALQAFTGDVVLYAGGWRSSCGSEAFFDKLEASFELVAQSALPSSFLADALRVFRRRA